MSTILDREILLRPSAVDMNGRGLIRINLDSILKACFLEYYKDNQPGNVADELLERVAQMPLHL